MRSLAVGDRVMASLRQVDNVAHSRRNQASLTFHSEVEAGWLLHDRHREHFNFFHALFHHGSNIDEEREMLPSEEVVGKVADRELAGPAPGSGLGFRQRRVSEGQSYSRMQNLFDDEAAWEAARPHLSRSVLERAEEAFLQHSDAVKELEEVLVVARQELGHTTAWSASVSEQHGLRGPQDEAISSASAPTVVTGLLQTAMMPARLLPRALKDLGLFPTPLELERYRRDLSLRRLEQLRTPCADSVQVPEPESKPASRVHPPHPGPGSLGFTDFVEIVKILLLDDLNAVERKNLHDMYMEFASEDGRLHRAGFGRLMDSVGHPMEADEIDGIVAEWQGEGQGRDDPNSWLTFDSFLSMMCVYLKREGLEEQLELDFLKFVGLYDIQGDGGMREIDEICAKLDRDEGGLMVTAEGVMAVYRHLDLPMDLVTAQDMIFDAGEEASDYITIEDFNRAILQVACHELVLDGERALRQFAFRRMRGLSDSHDPPPVKPSAVQSNKPSNSQRVDSLSRHGSPATLRRYATSVRQRRAHNSGDVSPQSRPTARSLQQEPLTTANGHRYREATV